jgi:hypothetical protein
MPTTTDATGRASAAGDNNTHTTDNSDALEGIYDSLRSGEATGEEAISATLHAFTDLVRAAVPVAMTQPARFVDLTFEVAQQAINFERRFIVEIVSGVQRVLTEPWADFDGTASPKGRNGRDTDHRTRTTRRAA